MTPRIAALIALHELEARVAATVAATVAGLRERVPRPAVTR